MQETQVYANVIDAIVMNSAGSYFDTPHGRFEAFALLKKIWFNIQNPKKKESAMITEQRNYWLSSARIVNGEIQIREGENWVSVALTLAPMEPIDPIQEV